MVLGEKRDYTGRDLYLKSNNTNAIAFKKWLSVRISPIIWNEFSKVLISHLQTQAQDGEMSA